MKPITVLIVDDSALIRHLFRELLSGQPDIQVLDTASDPLDAREKIKRLNPDVLTLDIEMPKMDGLSFLEKIMTLRPMPVIMASTLTQKGANETIRALELGAVDYVSKPTGIHGDNIIAALREELTDKVRAAAKVRFASRHIEKPTGTGLLHFTPNPAQPTPIIAIGSSTGGVEALRDLFQQLPANCPPIIMAQHMPEHFTATLAARLSTLSQVQVAEASDGARLMPGQAYIAPGNRHLKLAKNAGGFICRLDDGEKVSGHRPSVDVLFDSVAHVAADRALGVILTGMGKDGAAGMLNMRKAGAYTIGQDQGSCIVYGMPKAAQMLGAVAIELPLLQIARHILAVCETGKARSCA